MELEDRLPSRSVGRQYQEHPIETSRPAQGGVGVSRLIGGTEHEDALVVVAGRVELGQELHNDVSAGRVRQMAALLAEGVDLVEEEHARRVTSSQLEDLVEVLLALADPHVENLVEADGEEAGTELASDGAGEERLSAPRRSIE